MDIPTFIVSKYNNTAEFAAYSEVVCRNVGIDSFKLLYSSVIDDIYIEDSMINTIQMNGDSISGAISVSRSNFRKLLYDNVTAKRIYIHWGTEVASPQSITLTICSAPIRVMASPNALSPVNELNIKHCKYVKTLAGEYDIANIEDCDLSKCELSMFRPDMTCFQNTIGDNKYIRNVIIGDLFITYTSERAWVSINKNSVAILDIDCLSEMLSISRLFESDCYGDIPAAIEHILNHPAVPFKR